MGHPHRTTTTRRHGERGFTVSELVLVLVFVVGLVAVAVVSIRNIRDESSTSDCQTELRTLKLATEQYQSENGTYPVDRAVLIDAGLLEPGEVTHWAVSPGREDIDPIYSGSGPCG